MSEEFIVYVQLLGEGTISYRPVPAIKDQDGVCVLGGIEVFDENVETWEFKPGARMLYELRELHEGLSGELLPVATSFAEPR